MKPLVKICGMTNLEDAVVSASAGADMIGFIFYEKSPRAIQPSKAAGIIRYLPSTVIPFGVFVDEKRDIITKIIAEAHLKGIQLSGNESPEDCGGFNLPVWKAFRIRTQKEVERIRSYRVDAVMLDGASDRELGGAGTLADFEIAREMKKYHRVILAGGLNAENIVEAISTVQPYGVDIGSGVEMVPGKKDPNKVRDLIERIKG